MKPSSTSLLKENTWLTRHVFCFTSMAHTLLPGSKFPNLVIANVVGSNIKFESENGRAKLIVVYRGGFCPFCVATLKSLQASLSKLDASGIDLVAISADEAEVAAKSVAEMELTFPVGFGLNLEQMKLLGTFISSPTSYIPQSQLFSEPAWFFVNSDDAIKYLDYGSAPFSGRVNVDNLIAGYTWSTQNAKDHPEFKTVIWGSYV